MALLLFLVFTYLYEQTRQDYFRAWQLGWGAYTLHYVLDAWSAFRNPSAVISLLASLLLAAMALCIFISTRLMRERFRLRWYDIAVGLAGAGLSLWDLKQHMLGGVFHPELVSDPRFRLEVGVAMVLLYCSFFFYRYAHRKNSAGLHPAGDGPGVVVGADAVRAIQQFLSCSCPTCWGRSRSWRWASPW